MLLLGQSNTVQELKSSVWILCFFYWICFSARGLNIGLHLQTTILCVYFLCVKIATERSSFIPTGPCAQTIKYQLKGVWLSQRFNVCCCKYMCLCFYWCVLPCMVKVQSSPQKELGPDSLMDVSLFSQSRGQTCTKRRQLLKVFGAEYIKLHNTIIPHYTLHLVTYISSSVSGPRVSQLFMSCDSIF